MHGFAANTKLLEHYIEKFHAEYLGAVHQYQFFINEYYATPDPYSNPVPTKINLTEMSRYAQRVGKKLSELTKDEVKMFET